MTQFKTGYVQNVTYRRTTLHVVDGLEVQVSLAGYANALR